MRKVKALALAAVLIVAGAGMAGAAGQTGVGLQWGIGPAFVFGPFDQMKFSDSFTISWKVTDAVSVGVFHQGGLIGGEHEYSDDLTVPGSTFARRITIDAYSTIDGIGVSTKIPNLDWLSVGIELGVVSVNEDRVTYYCGVASDTTDATDFYNSVPRTAWDETGALEGLTVKASLLSAETKTINAEVGIMAALRFVQLQTANPLGDMEVTTTKVVKDEIDSIDSLNTLDLKLVVSLIF